MKTPAFFLAAIGSLCLHSVAYGFFFVIWLFHEPPSTPPIALLAYGDSSVEGLAVDAISLEPPGTLRRGNENTPGGDNAPKLADAAPPAPVELTQPPEDVVDLPKTVDETPEPEAVPPSASPTITDKPTEDKAGKKAADSSVAKLPGAPGGSRLPEGTPSKGGTVGVRSGVRMLGLAKPNYPREAIVRGIEGRVVLMMSISEEGKVTDVSVYQSSGHRILDDAALVYARSLQFIPARENNQPVAATYYHAFNYGLTDSR